MKNFKIRFINREIEIDFSHPKFVTANFEAQCTSYACQGNWKSTSVSIKKEEYTLEKLKEKILKEFNVYFY